MDYKVAYNNWLSNPKINAEAFEELSLIKDNEKEIEYRFGADLQFGTAGMRGIIGYGTNMMNIYTVKRATKGLAEYIKTLGFVAMQKGVAISYDTRKYSEVFAKATAGVLLSGCVHTRRLLAAHVERHRAQCCCLPKAEAIVAPTMRRPVGEVDVAARSQVPHHDGGMA